MSRDGSRPRAHQPVMRWSTIALVLCCACDHTVSVGEGPATILKQFPTSPDLDVLFVIDNSASTEDKQALLQQDMQAFVGALDEFPTGRPNLHIGVVTSTVDDGPGAAMLSATGCPSPNTTQDGRLQMGLGSAAPTGRYIIDIANPDGSRQTNYNGTLQDAFASIANVGAGGCGFEAHLAAIARALNGLNPENDGFLRPDADLAIVILADEDDASIKDGSAGQDVFTNTAGLSSGAIDSDFRVQPLFAYDCDQPITAGSGSATYTNCRPRAGNGSNDYLLDLDQLEQTLAAIKDPSQTSVSLIAGDPTTTIMTGALTIGGNPPQDPALLPSCSTTLADGNAIARPAIRLNAFASHYDWRGTFQTACQTDYSPALTSMAGTMTTMMTTDCLASNVDATDTDGSNAGIQPACTVTDHIGYATSTETDVAIPACPMTGATLPDPNGPRPCWWAQTDESCTQLGSELSLRIERATPAEAGTLVSINCAATN